MMLRDASVSDSYILLNAVVLPLYNTCIILYYKYTVDTLCTGIIYTIDTSYADIIYNVN